MAVRNVLIEGDETLRKKSREITEITPRMLTLIDDMAETMYANDGVGLAAPQVGVLRRVVIVADISGEEPRYIEMVNPEIVEQDGEQIGPEGCLSLPNIWGVVTRPQKVTVKAQDRFGEPFTLEAEDLLARACCHELDHLEGVLFDEIADRFLSEEEIEQMSGEEAE
jgi:peptide deformylase